MSTQLQLIVFSLALTGLVGGPFTTTPKEAIAGSAQYQADNISVFGDTADLVAGAATLTRTSTGISFSISTSELAPDEAHTIWIVIFNKPENCAAGPGVCVVSDLNVPEVEGSVVYGGGALVGPDGIANFVGSLGKGSPPAGIQMNVPLGTVNGLKHPMTAEIHLVVRMHGAVDVMGGAVAQLTTFQPDCAACANVQAVVFPGGAGDEDGNPDCNEDGVVNGADLVGAGC